MTAAEIQLLGREGLTVGESSGDFGPEFPDHQWTLTVFEPDERNVIRVELVIFAPEAGRTRETRFSTAVF